MDRLVEPAPIYVRKADFFDEEAFDLARKKVTQKLLDIAEVCGFTKISEHNLDLVYERVTFMQSLTGGLMEGGAYITLADIGDNVGLDTGKGVYYDQRDWFNKIYRMFIESIKHKVEGDIATSATTILYENEKKIRENP